MIVIVIKGNIGRVRDAKLETANLFKWKLVDPKVYAGNTLMLFSVGFLFYQTEKIDNRILH